MGAAIQVHLQDFSVSQIRVMERLHPESFQSGDTSMCHCFQHCSFYMILMLWDICYIGYSNDE